jgi:hypothetical protein
VNRDDWHLLAHAVASDVSVTLVWRCLHTESPRDWPHCSGICFGFRSLRSWPFWQVCLGSSFTYLDRVTRWVCGKVPQNVAQPALSKRGNEEKKVFQNIWAFSSIFKKTAQRKQSPNRRKIAQSCHLVIYLASVPLSGLNSRLIK